MSRDFMSDYLEHSWGKKPEQKAREKQYNAEYYKKNRDKWLNTDKSVSSTIADYQNALLDSGKSFTIHKKYGRKDTSGNNTEHEDARYKNDFDKYTKRSKNVLKNLATKVSDPTGSEVRINGRLAGATMDVKVSPGILRKLKVSAKETIASGKAFVDQLLGKKSDNNPTI